MGLCCIENKFCKQRGKLNTILLILVMLGEVDAAFVKSQDKSLALVKYLLKIFNTNGTNMLNHSRLLSQCKLIRYRNKSGIYVCKKKLAFQCSNFIFYSTLS